MSIFKSSSLSLFVKIYIAVIVPALIGLFFIEKGDLVIMLNGLHSPGLDLFFKYMTHYGDGWLLIGFLIVSLFISRYHSLLIVVAASLQGILTYLLKKVVFKGTPRPKTFFGQDVFDTFNLVEGVHVHALNSFPSGHTLTAFSFSVLICILFPKRWMATIALSLGVLAGISRVYLAQHFYMDIVAGSIVGVIVGIGAHWVLSKKINPTYMDRVLSRAFINLSK